MGRRGYHVESGRPGTSALRSENYDPTGKRFLGSNILQLMSLLIRYVNFMPMQPTARSLILDLLSTLRRGSMPVRALVEAGGLLGIEENNIRVSLARLYASKRIERDERGRYRLGPAVAAISQQLRNWRLLDTRVRPWKAEWIAVHHPRLGRGPARRRRERALDLLGFREFETGLSLRPDNLRGGLAEVRDQLVALASGTEPRDCALGRVFIVRDLDPSSDLEVRSLWDADAIAEASRRALESLRESESRLADLDNDEAMAETFLVGGRVLRQLLRHPLLPAEILVPEPLADLLAAMKRYDAIGRDSWTRFLARHDVPHRALPLDSRQSTLDFIPATL
jgi:phenylacetic acid degradation operon negative regulatory protein